MFFGNLLALSLVASPAEPTEGRIVAASLFKNGYAVVVREADFVAGQASILPPTGTVLGTLWVSASSGVKLQKVKTESVTTAGTRNAASLDELLSANTGKSITIDCQPVGSGEPAKYSGKILSADGPMVVMEAKERQIAIYKSSIIRVESVGGAFNFSVPTSSTTKLIKVTGTGEGKVYLVTLQRGATWSPAYQIDLVDDKTLTLTAKSTILNDLAPFDDITVSLVTGFPNIKFVGALDPLTSGYSVDQFVSNLAFAATDKEYRRDAMTQNAGGFSADPGFGMTPTGAGQQLEDLFLYKQPGVSLAVGERGYFALFSAKSAYEPIYTTDIPDGFDASDGYRGTRGGDNKLDVWHTLEFENTAGQPLTTAPSLVMKNNEVLGQDQIDYTSPGAKVRVKVTKSLDVQAETLEEELGRERGFIRVQDRPVYDRVTIKGTIELANHKQKAVNLVVTKRALGEAKDPGGATVQKTPNGLRQVNPLSVLTWKKKLEPGARIQLTYTVQVLVPG